MINVSWEDAVAYTRWLSDQTGERYRLPSEAEWEYAARAGTATKYHFGNDPSRLCRIWESLQMTSELGAERLGEPRPVRMVWGGRTAIRWGSILDRTAWGLHDMHGNVREWVQDCWNGNYQGAPTGGRAWESGRLYPSAYVARRVLGLPSLGNLGSAYPLQEAPGATDRGQRLRLSRGPDDYPLNL